MFKSAVCLAFIVAFVFVRADSNDIPRQYEPTWDSLDARPLPSWYDEAKIGIFIHWGVFSVPSFSSEWFWVNWATENGTGSISDFMRKNYPPGFTYQDFAKDFTAEFYDPAQWADLFQKSGAKYIVLTSKHHEGYTLWPSKYSFSWNALDVGPHRDVLGELATALRSNTDLHFGLYHSMFEWFNPLYLDDKANQFKTKAFVDQKTIPELYELVNAYKPDVIWSDGDWEADENYWGSKEFLTWLYNESPVRDTVAVNDRWGAGCGCNHGGFLNCADRYSPGVLQTRKWENALTIDRNSWGFRRNAPISDYFSIEEILEELVKTVSCGGNVLINVGPSKEGLINPIFQERLVQLGTWLGVNGEAIYKTQPWTFQNDTITPGVWYTKSQDSVYAILLSWPKDNKIELTSPEISSSATATLLADPSGEVTISQGNGIVSVALPSKASNSVEWAYVLKLTGVLN